MAVDDGIAEDDEVLIVSLSVNKSIGYHGTGLIQAVNSEVVITILDATLNKSMLFYY